MLSYYSNILENKRMSTVRQDVEVKRHFVSSIMNKDDIISRQESGERFLKETKTVKRHLEILKKKITSLAKSDNILKKAI